MPKIITPGRALLELIEDTEKDIRIINRLIKISTIKNLWNIDLSRLKSRLKKMILKNDHLIQLYLTGANSLEQSINLYDALLDDNFFKNTDFAIDEISITSDPSRRVFETTLAYWTVKNNLHKLNVGDLESLITASFALVKRQRPEYEHKTIHEVFNGECVNPTFRYDNNLEFSEYIRKIKAGEIFTSPNFSDEERNKIILLIRAVYSCILNGWGLTEMPLTIYHSDSHYLNRGRLKYDKDQKSTRSSNYGILRSYMPTFGIDDIAYSPEPLPFRRSPDYCNPDLDSEASQKCFSQLVHPYVTGLSGVMLVQLCVLAKLNDSINKSIYTSSLQEFCQYIQLMSCVLLFCSGGHSLYEYATVLSLEQTKETFSHIQGFDKIDILSLYYKDNHDAVNKGVAASIKYNGFFEKRKIMHQELLKKTTCLMCAEQHVSL